MITKGKEYQYHFSVSGQEKDTPNGFVIFYLSNTSASDAAGVSYVEIVKPYKGNYTVSSNPLATVNSSESLWELKSQGATTTAQSNKSLVFPESTPKVRAFPFNRGDPALSSSQAFGQWTNRSEAPKETIVFSYGVAIARMDSAGPFIIPAGEYWCRFMDNYSSGRQFGRNSTQWRYVNLLDNVGTVVTATLDNTTGFVWRGEQVDAVDTSVINPDLNIPWLNPVTGVTTSGSTAITWTRSAPQYTYTGGPYYKGVQVTIERSTGIEATPWMLQKWTGTTTIGDSTSDGDTTQAYYYNTNSAPKMTLPTLTGGVTYRIVIRATNGLNGIAGTGSTALAPSLATPNKYYMQTGTTTSVDSADPDDLHFSEIFEFYLTR
jgi:hypothetical protein